MNEEERKAIEHFKNDLEMTKEMGKKWGFQEEIKNNETILNLIEKQEKIIQVMAEFLEDETTIDDFCNKENCCADEYINGHCEKCLNCIVEYFTKKVGE